MYSRLTRQREGGMIPQSTTPVSILVPPYIHWCDCSKPSGLTSTDQQQCSASLQTSIFQSFPSPEKSVERKTPSLAHLPLDLTENLLLQFGRVILLQHVVLPPRLCPLLGVLHLLWGQGPVKAYALDVELWSFPAFGPRLGAHPYLQLVKRQKC